MSKLTMAAAAALLLAGHALAQRIGDLGAPAKAAQGTVLIATR